MADPDEYPHPRPKRNGNGIAALAVIFAVVIILTGVWLTYGR